MEHLARLFLSSPTSAYQQAYAVLPALNHRYSLLSVPDSNQPAFPFHLLTPVSTPGGAGPPAGPDFASDPPRPEESLIVALALRYPFIGLTRIRTLLLAQGLRWSTAQLQQVLLRERLSTLPGRWLALEGLYQTNKLTPNPDQVKLLEKMNPAFRERHEMLTAPGETLLQTVLPLQQANLKGRWYVHLVVDTYSNYTFHQLQDDPSTQAALALLAGQVLPFFKERKLEVSKVLTGSGREYCGVEARAFRVFLAHRHIAHHVLPGRSGMNNGFLKRFYQIFHQEFLRRALRQMLSGQSIWIEQAKLNQSLTQWLAHYNQSQPSLGYPNYGWSPLRRLEQYNSQPNQ